MPDDTSRRRLGDAVCFESFHCHGKTFNLPRGAARIASSPYCVHQIFALGKH
jgi:GMP synthase-like glutamine amidotransferase